MKWEVSMRIWIAGVLGFVLAQGLSADPIFDDHFTGKSLRFDYYHSGTAEEEHI